MTAQTIKAGDDSVLQWVTFRLGNETYDTRIVILESDNQVVGILVDSVAEVVYLKASEIETAPNVGNDESSRYIQGVCHKNDELLILIEIAKLLTEREWQEIAEL